jgi:hypothetical protein
MMISSSQSAWMPKSRRCSTSSRTSLRRVISYGYSCPCGPTPTQLTLTRHIAVEEPERSRPGASVCWTSSSFLVLFFNSHRTYTRIGPRREHASKKGIRLPPVFFFSSELMSSFCSSRGRTRICSRTYSFRTYVVQKPFTPPISEINLMNTIPFSSADCPRSVCSVLFSMLSMVIGVHHVWRHRRCAEADDDEVVHTCSSSNI